ncbi:hypothetical protein OG897_03985 [Streptomyces sp. NBC_00237]|uniref:hypothetical protein n=1 Tax=Streptomyces sp. NBC_00237 TaxID=2975687 RepID=UPI0022542CCC|nr:hypothetical protein [Streptomyces sp. NBC_00237]MCX5200625.1 hypothetical protein [Streptomyces sp. NBC_00237]
MKKISALAGLVLSSIALAAPAHADNGDDPANKWNFSAEDVCVQELAVVPALSDWTGNHRNNCSNGNVIGPAPQDTPQGN